MRGEDRDAVRYTCHVVFQVDGGNEDAQAHLDAV